MLDKLFDLVCGTKYHVMVITGYIEDEYGLYAIPCEEAMSGCYPAYDKRIKIADRVDNFYLERAQGILIRKYEGAFDIKISEDSWDGFQ